jgi:hypothetical protein
METLEREITREQAQLLFNLPDDGVKVYRLRLVPALNDTGKEQEASPFETEQELAEFMGWANREWLAHEAW